MEIFGTRIILPALGAPEVDAALAAAVADSVSGSGAKDLRAAIGWLSAQGWDAVWQVAIGKDPQDDAYELRARSETPAAWTIQRIRQELGPSDLMSVKQAADYAGVRRQTILARIDAGTLPAERIGAQYVVHRADMDAWTPARRGPAAKKDS